MRLCVKGWGVDLSCNGYIFLRGGGADDLYRRTHRGEKKITRVEIIMSNSLS